MAWKALHADRTRKNQIGVGLTVRQGNRLAVAILVRLFISKKRTHGHATGRLLQDDKKGNNLLSIDTFLMLETLFWLHRIAIAQVFFEIAPETGTVLRWCGK
jgi:hypothetical protein